MITEMFRALALSLSLLLASPALAGDVYNPGFSSVGDYPDVDNPTGGCSDSNATAWVNAVVTAGGTVSSGQKTNVCNLIAAYKTAGIFTLLSHEWLYASENATQAKIDIINLASHTLIGSPTFSVNNGYSGWGTNVCINTNFSSDSNFTLNSASFGAFLVTSQTSGGSSIGAMGSVASSPFTYFKPLNGSSVLEFDLNAASFPTQANANMQGNYIFSRTSSSAIVVYKNGAAGVSSSSTSTSLNSSSIYVGAFNGSGTCIQPMTSTEVIASAFVGAGLNSTQAAAKYTALRAYMTAVGLP
jgi:hypothetical protein